MEFLSPSAVPVRSTPTMQEHSHSKQGMLSCFGRELLTDTISSDPSLAIILYDSISMIGIGPFQPLQDKNILSCGPDHNVVSDFKIPGLQICMQVMPLLPFGAFPFKIQDYILEYSIKHSFISSLFSDS